MQNNVFTIGIGGAAGDGVREAGMSLGQLLAELGYEVFISHSYPSLIRGGHNFTRLSFSKEKIWCDHEKLDILIALNSDSIDKHKGELKGKDSVVMADSFSEKDKKELGNRALSVPMAESAKKLDAAPITRNSVAIGAVCYLIDMDLGKMNKVIEDIFRDKMLEKNLKLADIGYEYLKKINYRHALSQSRGLPSEVRPRETREILDGNIAVGKGLMAAGLDFYVAYPMTPATGLLHFLASAQGSPEQIHGGTNLSSNSSLNSSAKLPSKLSVIQPESELSVINMALGMAYAGKKVAVGSAAGGFMLMQESLSFAAMAELPIVIMVAQRQAPATGVPTYSSQTDLLSTIHSGHGEFTRIVIAPGDVEESYRAGAAALDLAWKYRVPVLILTDKILCEHASTGVLKTNGTKGGVNSGANNGGDWFSMFLPNLSKTGGVPFREIETLVPGTPGVSVKVTSYEHDSQGIPTDDPLTVKAMANARVKKAAVIRSEFSSNETVKVYGNPGSRNVVTFWGSTKGAVLESLKFLDQKRWPKLVQILWAEPFDGERVKRELEGAKKVINIECNHGAQMASLIREKTGIVATDNILKYDARPFDPEKLAEQIMRRL